MNSLNLRLGKGESEAIALSILTSCTSCNNAIFVGWAMPTIDRGLFLRWWAVPNAQRESRSCSRETEIQGCLTTPRGRGEPQRVTLLRRRSQRLRQLPAEGNPHRRTGLTAHSLWLSYTNYRMVQDISIETVTLNCSRQLLYS